MTILRETLIDPSGEPVTAPVTIKLVGAYDTERLGYTSDGSIIVPVTVDPDRDGAWSVDLVPNEDIEPGGTAYRVMVGSTRRWVTVPDTGPVDVEDRLTTPPLPHGVLHAYSTYNVDFTVVGLDEEPTAPDATPTAEFFTHDDTLLWSRAATATADPAVFRVVLSSVETETPGLYYIRWSYDLDGVPQAWRTNIEILESVAL